MKKLSLICALLLLTACGSDTRTSSPPEVPTPPPPPAGPVADAFYNAVKTTVAAMPDDSEAASIDTIASTAPEDTEPSTL
ncbi:hypothetical protein [Massilia antarctica]|uniref:hypothetical protein n=1 Tax=Massilia antarctica TaxID=2765360 RepID=UPI0006BB874D|nr:hypothetical protein [Massilia sp. H27-R4]MCY0911013.1 hypothetical protein [Massilia sp. H27-R4]CUI05413.1 hypothetical protein BN2497_5603 [Janthinobacterium sp. CG23_2]CUU29199.1 hypothetical protein BN3177_5603 [Janthinobacterium sp. CG23_2]